jgi:hypothetical protein
VRFLTAWAEKNFGEFLWIISALVYDFVYVSLKKMGPGVA